MSGKAITDELREWANIKAQNWTKAKENEDAVH